MLESWARLFSTLPPYIFLLFCSRFAVRETKALNFTTRFFPWEKAKQNEHGNRKTLKTQALGRIPLVIAFSNKFVAAHSMEQELQNSSLQGKGTLAEVAVRCCL